MAWIDGTREGGGGRRRQEGGDERMEGDKDSEAEGDGEPGEDDLALVSSKSTAGKKRRWRRRMRGRKVLKAFLPGRKLVEGEREREKRTKERIPLSHSGSPSDSQKDAHLRRQRSPLLYKWKKRTKNIISFIKSIIV